MKGLRTRYAKAPDGVYIAYQSVGEGDLDLVWQPDWPGNIDSELEFPVLNSLFTALASFSRLIRHDHRGVGLSSRNLPVPTLETRVADLLLVLDSIGSAKPVLVGTGVSGAVNALLAASRPERVSGLVWMDGAARSAWAHDYPWGRRPAEREELVDLESWGTEEYGRRFAQFEASIGNPFPEASVDAFSKASRNASTPDVAIELAMMWAATDVREILPTIQVPTLVLVFRDMAHADSSRLIAARILHAELVEVPGDGYTRDGMERYAEEIRRFVGGARSPDEIDSVLSTVLVHGHRRVNGASGGSGRSTLGRPRRDASRSGTGVAPALARRRTRHGRRRLLRDVRGARAGDPVRAGDRRQGSRPRHRDPGRCPHRECRVVDGKMGGLAVAIGARVAGTAKPSEVRVSQTVKDPVAGSGLAFEDAGEHELKGVPDRWRLYRVMD